MPNPTLPTRAELAQLLKSPRMIKAFEELFNLIPSSLDTLENSSDGGVSMATEANATAQESLRITKGANVLLWLSI